MPVWNLKNKTLIKIIHMRKEQNLDNNAEHQIVYATLLYAFKKRIDRVIDKCANRLLCTHDNYAHAYCVDTHIYMYSKCCSCGKKKHFV